MIEIRGKSIPFASYKKKLKNIHEQKLIKEIKVLEFNLTENNTQSLKKLKLELCKLREESMKGFLVCSRANNIENGENPSPFFLLFRNK